MPIVFACECGKRIRALDEMAGNEWPCPACGRLVTVPFPDPDSAAKTQESTSADEWERDVAAAEGARTPHTASAAAKPPSPPRRSVLDVLLDPRSIQWMLTLGGALMVLGLIIFLASLGVFKDPKIVAGCLGLGTIVTLGAGCFIVLKTSYRVAGQALAFLACVVAPLNLWFYHAQDLITLQGHLWVCGLVCCLIYAATAYALRDPLFVYVVEGGATLTILLFMAELGTVNQVATLCLFFTIAGVLSIHAERAFPAGESQFSRGRFGMPLFWSGQAQLGVGLLLLLAAQVMGWLRLPVDGWLGYDWNLQHSDGLPLLTGALWLAGTYAYLYSDIVVRRVGVYTFLAAFCLLMAEVAIVTPNLNAEGMIVVLALTALGANLLQVFVVRGHEKLNRAVPPIGIVLTGLSLLIGHVLHMRATAPFTLVEGWRYETDPWFVGAMLLVAATSRVSALLYRKEARAWSATYFFMSAAAALIAAAGLLRVLGITNWTEQAPLLMLIPIAYMIASRLWEGHSPEHPLAWVAQTATVVMFLHVIAGGLQGVDSMVTGEKTNLWRGLFFAEAAAFYVLTATVRQRGKSVFLAAAMACASLWQLLAYREIPIPYYALVYAGLGMALLVFSRVIEAFNRQPSRIVTPAFQCGNMVLSLSFLAALFQGLAHLATGKATKLELTALFMTTGTSLIACWVVRQSEWKRWYVTTTIGLAGLTFLTMNVLSDLSRWQKLEIFCVLAGVAMLIVSYLGRLREQADDENELISIGLWLGSLLATLPILISVLGHRFGTHTISMPDELSLLTITLLMVVTGYIWQFKATTLIGGLALVAHLAIMAIFVGFEHQVALGVYLALGGALLFGAGIGLAVYREKLLKLPGQIANREGVFQVMGWR